MKRTSRIAGVFACSAAVCILLLVAGPIPAAETPDRGDTRPRVRRPPARPRPGWRRRTPEGVKAIRDIVYATAGAKKLLLDLYVPEKSGGPLPVIVWVHGGGWRNGSKAGARALPMTANGFAVASINYRLSHEATFPAEIHDCKAAVRWLRANAETHNLDAAHIGVWGSSAGGHLVALLGTGGDVKELEGHLGNARESSRVQAVCDYFGPADFTALMQTGWHRGARSPESRLLGGTLKEKPELAKQASPVTFASKDDPPFLIVHGEKDNVVPIDQSRRLHEALTKAGVDSTFHTVKGAGHGFRGQDGPRIEKLVLDFFNRHLKPGTTRPAAE